MTSTLVTNIKQLVTNDPELGTLADAALVYTDGKISWVGEKTKAPAADSLIDADGGSVIPGFVDSHTHAIFAGDRLQDFLARMNGTRYASGGIETTVAETRAATNESLRNHLENVVTEFTEHGITTFEIKSGYGLDVDTELKLLRIAKEFTDETTFLGAHVIPSEFTNDRRGYIDLVKGKMLETVAPHAKWIDAFCDNGALTVEEAREIILAGQAKGLLGRLHGNQLGDTGGIELAIELGLASVDHCTYATDVQLESLAASKTVATLLPGAEFSTRSPYPDARRFFEKGVKVALATDFNPGSSYISSMPFVMAIAVRDMHFTPEQALVAATKGGADALRRTDVGHLGVGARADIVILDVPSFEYIAYRPGTQLIKKVLVANP
ncbi:MAG: imidazolonepropionase [Actinomycetes bacterium]